MMCLETLSLPWSLSSRPAWVCQILLRIGHKVLRLCLTWLEGNPIRSGRGMILRETTQVQIGAQSSVCDGSQVTCHSDIAASWNVDLRTLVVSLYMVSALSMTLWTFFMERPLQPLPLCSLSRGTHWTFGGSGRHCLSCSHPVGSHSHPKGKATKIQILREQKRRKFTVFISYCFQVSLLLFLFTFRVLTSEWCYF